jgi:excisionase family DNA binding protein
MQMEKRLLNQKEAAEYLGISVRQLEYLAKDGKIHQTRLPNTRKRLYDRKHLDAIAEKWFTGRMIN